MFLHAKELYFSFSSSSNVSFFENYIQCVFFCLFCRHLSDPFPLMVNRNSTHSEPTVNTSNTNTFSFSSSSGPPSQLQLSAGGTHYSSNSLHSHHGGGSYSGNHSGLLGQSAAQLSAHSGGGGGGGCGGSSGVLAGIMEETLHPSSAGVAGAGAGAAGADDNRKSNSESKNSSSAQDLLDLSTAGANSVAGSARSTGGDTVSSSPMPLD